MKALLSLAPGGPDSLELHDIAAPTPGTGEVLIANHACAINYPETLVIRDLYQFKPQRPFAPGGELAGVVVAVGDRVDSFKPGDRVCALTLIGGLAEQVVAPAAKCFALPDAVDFPAAAALLLTYGTVLHALRDRGRLVAGEVMLVLGAAGGIGLAAIELGKHFGARVVAAVSTEAKAQAAREAGADDVVIYPTGEIDKAASKALADMFKAACGKAGAQVVFDAVGGAYSEPALRAIGWGGRFLVVGFPAGIAKLPLNLTLLKSCDVCGVFYGAFTDVSPEQFRAQSAELLYLLAQGTIRPRIGQSMPLERGGEAIALLADRKAIGKVVVTIA